MLLDLCPKVLSPRNTKTSYVLSIWVSNARMEATFWAPIWAKLAILGPFKLPGSYSYASWGKVGGSWGQVGPSGNHVKAKLGYVMLCWSYRSGFLRPCCWFCIPKCPSASYVCPMWGQVRLPYGYVGAILGPTSAILGPGVFHFPVETSTFWPLSYWNLYFLITLWMESLFSVTF